MRGPKPSYPIILTETEAKELEQVVRAHTTPQALARRTGPYASGAVDGSRPIIWPTRPAVERRGVFPPRVRAQVTAIACSLPRQCQVPLSRWSRAELARRVAQDPTLPHISASTVGRWRNRRTPSSLALSCLAAHP